jgi:hypothetical protein
MGFLKLEVGATSWRLQSAQAAIQAKLFDRIVLERISHLKLLILKESALFANVKLMLTLVLSLVCNEDPL